MLRLSLLFMIIAFYQFLGSSSKIIYDYWDHKESNNKHTNVTKFKIGFGSCFKDYGETPTHSKNIFDTILKEDILLWVWLGDFAYLSNNRSMVNT